MFWEIAQDIKRYFKTTFFPSVKNLFSSVRSLAGLMLVMLILQLLLGVICITGIENIRSQQVALKEFSSALDAQETVIESTEGSFMTSDEFKTALSGTTIFIGAILIWVICAVTVYKKITFSSADRDKYIWGMLITHGAKKKKIKAMLRCELYIPMLAVTAISYPLSILFCNYALRDYGYSYSHSLLKLLAVVVLSYVCIRLVVEYQCFLISSMSCTEMLREEDAPKSVCYPRKNARLVKGFTPLRYGTSAFFRMRKYYLSLALLVAVPAVIWICLYVSVASEDNYLTSSINEFSVKSASGFTENEINKLQSEKFDFPDQVEGIDASAVYSSSRIYTHLLADKSHFSTVVSSPYYTSSYADNTIKITKNDRAFKQMTGFTAPTVERGTAIVVCPSQASEYRFSQSERLYFAVSENGGDIRTVTENELSLLEGDMENEYDYIELKIAEVYSLNSSAITKSGFLNINDTYVLLSNDDYEKVTSLDTERFSSHIDKSLITLDDTLDSRARFDISMPLSATTVIPKAGDCMDTGGKYTLSFDITGLPSYEGATPDEYKDKHFTREFDYVYINSVNISGDTLTLNVTPCDTVLIDYPDVALVLGTPDLQSVPKGYCMATYDSITVKSGTVELGDKSYIIYTSSTVSACEAGTHVLVKESHLASAQGRLPLEELYADDSFDIACGDETTLKHMEIDAPEISESGAVLVLPSNSPYHLSFEVGDKLRIATTKYNVSQFDKNAFNPNDKYDILTDNLKQNQYDYNTLYITDIIYSDKIDAPTVIVSTESFVAIIGKYKPYMSFEILLSSDIDSDAYLQLRDSISMWASKIPLPPSVSSSGEFLQHLLRKNANYSAIIKVISILVPLIIPFIWYYPLSSLFDRRRTELVILNAFGKKKSTVRSCFFFEGSLVTLSAFASVFLLCYPAMLAFKVICTLFKMPIEFEYQYLSIEHLLFAAGVSALCAAISFAVCFTTTKKKKSKKTRRKYANT